MQLSNDYVFIMAGGLGTRFWPASRHSLPKQFLDVLGVGQTLLQLTVKRFERFIPKENIFIVTSEEHGQLALEQSGLAPQNIIMEPARKNTAPCIAMGMRFLEQINPQARVVLAPSDHLILNEAEFVKKLQEGLNFVGQNEALLTLGIQPHYPNTGYGYIHFDAQAQGNISKVKQFTEKPELEKAKAFLAGGEHLWNAGIYLWSVQTIQKALAKHSPSLYQAFQNYDGQLQNKLAVPQGSAAIYEQIESISIDYAVSEKADNIYTLPADIGWSDVGTWQALQQVAPNKDEDNNLVLGLDKKQCQLANSKNNLLYSSQNRPVILYDLDNMLVVDEPQLLLLAPLSAEQHIKEIRQAAVEQWGEDLL